MCREKFEELQAKERELNAFLDAFPQRKAAKQSELTAKQEAIVAVLERMNKLQAITDAALPSHSQYQQMKVRELDMCVACSTRVLLCVSAAACEALQRPDPTAAKCLLTESQPCFVTVVQGVYCSPAGVT